MDIPEYIEIILNEDDNSDGAWYTRWARALQAAVDHSEDQGVVRQIVLHFDGQSFNLTSKFAWVDILQAAGWGRGELAALLLDRFEVEDPNCDLPALRRHEFLCHQPAWWLAEPEQMKQFVWRMVEIHPFDVLRLNAALAAKIGQAEADKLAKEASRRIDRIHNDLVVTEVVWRLGGTMMDIGFGRVRHRVSLLQAVALRLAAFATEHRFGHTSQAEVSLLVWAALGEGLGQTDEVDIWLGIKRAIEWRGCDQKPGVGHSIHTFRWLIKLAEEAPFTPEAWMTNPTCGWTPESVRQRRVASFKERLRKVMTDLGFRFVRVVEGRDQNGRPQLEAEHAGRVFVQSNQPDGRGEVIHVGDEVIIAKPEGKPSFVRDGGRTDGYLVHLHPVAQPTAAMVAAATPSHLVPANTKSS
jgi:hypothetical protein